MFKKILVLSAALAMALWAVPALAAIGGTAHDYPTRDGGACAACHLPHGAVQGGLRLWPSSPLPAIPAASGSIGPLCGYCHFMNGGFTGDNNPDRRQSNYIYQPGTSHGMRLQPATPPRGYNVPASPALPYLTAGTADGYIECTTCHDVHNDPSATVARGYRPFLRGDINTLCTHCHTNRMFKNNVVVNTSGNAALMGSWGIAPYTAPGSWVGVNNSGSHPVGKDIDSNRYGGNSPILIYRTLREAVNGTIAGGWVTGGHLTAGRTGGVTCVSCHAVHGLRNDYDMAAVLGAANNALAADSHYPYVNFLVVQQAAGADQNGRSVANGGFQLGYNALCEACHQGAALNAAYAAGAITSLKNSNPGGTQYGHPVDNMTSAYYTWVTAFPANWPVGCYPNVSSPNVICESCHVAHPLANIPAGNIRNDLTSVTDYDFILRGSATGVCNRCHSGASSGHHPVGDTYTKATVLYLNPGAGVTGTVQCGTCHGGAGAHNYVSGRSDVGMNANWLPYNNGRYASVGSDRYALAMSKTCMDCHYGIRNTQNPTAGDALNAVYSDATEDATTFAPALGMGTHALGRMGQNGVAGIRLSKGTKAAYWGCFGARLGNVETAFWTAAYGGVGGWSRFGGNAVTPVLVCESCHELQPAKNSSTHLLLGAYTEKLAANMGTHSAFCEGCHVPSGTHPMTGDNVGTQGNHTLVTSITGRPYLQVPTDPNLAAQYTQANPYFTCDSCHQPHNAPTAGRTFVLDCNAAAISLSTSPSLQTVAQFGSYGLVYGRTYGYFSSVWNAKPSFQRFCSACHPY